MLILPFRSSLLISLLILNPFQSQVSSDGYFKHKVVAVVFKRRKQLVNTYYTECNLEDIIYGVSQGRILDHLQFLCYKFVDILLISKAEHLR